MAQGFEPLTKWEMAHINLLPEFNGTSDCNLDYFLVQCESFLRNFHRSPETPNAELTNMFLFNVVKAKIKGEAQSVLDVETNSNFERLKEKLIRKYGDARDEHILFREISNCCQKRNESFLEYHDRLNQLLIKYKSTLKLNHQNPILEMKLQEADGKALGAFRAGILNPYREYLRYAQITDLSQALRACRDYDNERAYENYMDSLRNNQKQNLPTPNQQVKTNQTPTFNFRSSFPTPFTHSNFTPNMSRFQPMPHRPEPSRVLPPHVSQPQNHTQQNLHRSPLIRPPQFRPPVGQGRPYPHPLQIGRIHDPPNQPQGNRQTPMSGVSTIRQNANYHYNDNQIDYTDYSGQNYEDTYDETSQKYDYYYPEQTNENFETSEFVNQDFREVASSIPKT